MLDALSGYSEPQTYLDLQGTQNDGRWTHDVGGSTTFASARDL